MSIIHHNNTEARITRPDLTPVRALLSDAVIHSPGMLMENVLFSTHCRIKKINHTFSIETISRKRVDADAGLGLAAHLIHSYSDANTQC